MEEKQSNISIGGDYTGDITFGTKNVNSFNTTTNLQERQTLAEAAEEIQKLLKQLEMTNPTATDSEKERYIDAKISKDVKSRVVGALQAGGEAAIEEFLANPYVNVVKATVKGWLEAK